MKGEGGGGIRGGGGRDTTSTQAQGDATEGGEELRHLLFLAQICGSLGVLPQIISALVTFPIGGLGVQ